MIITQEYCSFGDCSRLIRMHKAKEVSFTEEQVVKLLIQLVRGLQAAYKEDTIHHDIKPANIFICSNGIVKLGDFGVAESTYLEKIYGPQKGQKDVGTLPYMAKEIWDNEEFIDNMDSKDKLKLY
jgi:serine/threonine protein kinase